MYAVMFYESVEHEMGNRQPHRFRAYRDREDATATARELESEDFVYRAWSESE